MKDWLIVNPMRNTFVISLAIFISLSFLIVSCSDAENSITVNADRKQERTDTVAAAATKSDDYYDKSIDVSAATDISAFIPDGYLLLDSTYGNLNLDSYKDLILVLKKKGEDLSSDVSEHPEKRPLLILTGEADGSYVLAARNDNTVYCVDCGGAMGDPFVDVVITNGYFSIEHFGGSGWRWSRIVTYRYADKNWWLYKDGHESFHASDPEKVESKILTEKDFGRIRFDAFDIYKER
jgi:hypothetical protein